MQVRSRISVICLDKGHEVWVVGIIVLDEHSFVLKTNDGDPIPIVFCERGDSKAKGRPWSRLMAQRRGLAPVYGMDGPYHTLGSPQQ